jgi:hypothetical protein
MGQGGDVLRGQGKLTGPRHSITFRSANSSRDRCEGVPTAIEAVVADMGLADAPSAGTLLRLETVYFVPEYCTPGW